MREVIQRLAVAGVLVTALVGMTIHYGAVDARHDRTAIDNQLPGDPDDHVGETVFFWGEAIRSEGGTLLVRVPPWTLAVRTDRDPPAGSAVQVYGRLEPGNEVTPERVIVSPAPRLRYLYAISAVGGLFAAVTFLRTWRFDVSRLAFVPRGRTMPDRYVRGEDA